MIPEDFSNTQLHTIIHQSTPFLTNHPPTNPLDNSPSSIFRSLYRHTYTCNSILLFWSGLMLLMFNVAIKCCLCCFMLLKQPLSLSLSLFCKSILRYTQIDLFYFFVFFSTADAIVKHKLCALHINTCKYINCIHIYIYL